MNNESNRKKITRAGSGRTKGSVSFVTIELGELCAKIADPKTRIKVSRLQMEALGFIPQAADAAPQILKPTPKPTVTVTDLDAPASTSPTAHSVASAGDKSDF